MTTWTLAPNLARIRSAVLSCYPGMTVGTIGDAAHQAEHSDHDPDARRIVHAADFMTFAYQQQHSLSEAQCAAVILAWLLSPGVRDSLEYVIHNRVIYTAGNGWRGEPYTGSDPHTDHIHASGRHGTTGRNSATGTGYSTAAEAMTPAGTPCTHTEATMTAPTPHNIIWDPSEIDNQDPATKAATPKVALGTAITDLWKAVNVIGEDVDVIKTAVLPPIVGAPNTAMAGSISDADVQRIATAVVELLDARLAS